MATSHPFVFGSATAEPIRVLKEDMLNIYLSYNRERRFGKNDVRKNARENPLCGRKCQYRPGSETKSYLVISYDCH